MAGEVVGPAPGRAGRFKKSSCLAGEFYSNYRTVNGTKVRYQHIMKIEIAVCLLSAALLSACSSTSQTTAEHQTLEQRLMAKYASNDTTNGEPAPPAAGPNDVPADAPTSVEDNPALVPSPALRLSAASSTP